MASYFATGSVASGTAAHVGLIETALTAAGWTLYDTGSFGTRVWQSPDVNGVAGVSFFIWIASPGSLGVTVALDWDPVTHTGLMTSGSATAGGGSTPAGTYYIYANSLGFTYYVDGSPFTALWVGQPRSRMLQNQTDGMCLSTASMSAAATSVTVSEDLTGRLYVGQQVVIQNFAHDSTSGNASNTEMVTVTGVTNTTLSFTATSNAYDSGAKIGPPDMLWPLGGSFQAFETFSSGYLQAAIMAVGQRPTPLSSSGNTAFFSPSITFGSVLGPLKQTAGNGDPAETGLFLASSNTSGDQGYGQPIWGWLGAYIPQSGGSPAAGTKYTDGTNVFIQATTNNVTGPKVLFGPTGDTPDFNTMTRLLPPVIEVSDSIYTFPPHAPTTSAPTNKLNQGLN